MSDKPILVFGSNTHGIHGAGAALAAYKKHGARFGMGYGHYGDSFAIPTKGVITIGDKKMVGDPLTLYQVQQFVNGFIAYAEEHPELTFQITRIGCGLAGFTDSQMSALFIGSPLNCQFDEVWKPVLGNKYTYWGTF